MFLQSFLLATTAPMLGTMAQSTSVVDWFLATGDNIWTGRHGNLTLLGSVISAATDATTYSINSLSDGTCSWTWCKVDKTYVNGPSTFAKYLTEGHTYTEILECHVSGQYHTCNMVFTGTSAIFKISETKVFVHTSSSWTPGTITAGMEKILAVSTATSSTAQTASPASSGPAETGASASATSSSTRAGKAATAIVRKMALAAFSGALMLVWGL